jgi:ABC-2 type transport system permease protein
MKINPYFLVFKASLAKDMAYRFNYLFTYVLHLTKLLVYLAVWHLIFTDHNEILHYTWGDIASYYALSTIVLLLLFPTHMFELQPLIRKGTLNSILIRPINIEANILAKFLASKLPTLLIMSVLTYLVFQLLGIKIHLSISIFSVILLVLSFFLAFYFGLFVSSLAFWLIEMWPIRRVFQGCMALLGGVIAPLDLLPNSVTTVAILTPFPYFGYFNVKALQGTLSTAELQMHCLIIIAWILLFIFAFKILWKLGLKQYEAVNL